MQPDLVTKLITTFFLVATIVMNILALTQLWPLVKKDERDWRERSRLRNIIDDLLR